MALSKKPIVSILLLGFIFFIVSCSKRETGPLPKVESSPVLNNKSEHIKADVFYDATLSMQGFVNPGITTDYARVLDRLEGSITTGWPDAMITFYKFGTRITELSGREQKNVVKPAFFNDPELRGITSIESVIDTANTEHLTIIVTDLFQDDADVTQLVNKVKDKFLSKDASVGLLGVRSEFKGTVFDVGILRDRFDYGRDNIRKRPFYILMIGKHRDIEHLYNSLNIRILNEQPDKNFILLSRHFSYPLPVFENANVLSKEYIDETTNILPNGSKDPRVKQLRIKSGHPQSHLTLLLRRSRLPYTLELDPSAFESRLIAQKVETIGNRDTLVTHADVIDAFRADVAISDSSLQLRIKVDGSKLATTGIYIFGQTIYLNENVDLLPKWISDWDMNITRLPDWKQKPTTFEGDTTLNLKKFTFDLYQAIIQTQRPELAHIFYYIRKE